MLSRMSRNNHVLFAIHDGVSMLYPRRCNCRVIVMMRVWMAGRPASGHLLMKYQATRLQNIETSACSWGGGSERTLEKTKQNFSNRKQGNCHILTDPSTYKNCRQINARALNVESLISVAAAAAVEASDAATTTTTTTQQQRPLQQQQ